MEVQSREEKRLVCSFLSEKRDLERLESMEQILVVSCKQPSLPPILLSMTVPPQESLPPPHCCAPLKVTKVIFVLLCLLRQECVEQFYSVMCERMFAGKWGHRG